MKPIYLLIPAIMLLGSCATSLSALCDPEDTACIEAALAAEAAATAPASGDLYRDHEGSRGRVDPPDDDDDDPNE